jgi:hypothetical protein
MWVGMIVSGYGRHAGMQPGTKPKMDKDHLSMMGFRPPASEALSKLNDFYGLADGAQSFTICFLFVLVRGGTEVK